MPPTLSEMFINGIQKQEGTSLDSSSGAAVGAQLAQLQQQREQQAAQIKQRQEELQLAKLEKVGGWFEQASKMEDGGPKKAFVKNFIPNGIQALGMGDAFHPTSLQMFSEQPLVVPFMSDKIRRGELQMGDLLGAMANPDKAAALFASPDFAQFGAQKEIMDAAQDSMGTLKKSAEFAASEEGKAYRAKIAAEAQKSRQGNTFGHQDEQFGKRQVQDFGKAVANPGQRSGLGKDKDLIASVDSVLTLTDSAGMGKGQHPNPDESHQESVARYDNLNGQQLEEVVRGLDRVISRSQPTVSGQEHLRPDTIEGLAKKYGQKIFNTPVGTGQGEFIAQMVETLHRERSTAESRARQNISTLRGGYVEGNDKYKDKMDKIERDAIPTRPTGQVDMKAKAREYIKKYGRNAKGSAAALKVLGGE